MRVIVRPVRQRPWWVRSPFTARVAAPLCLALVLLPGIRAVMPASPSRAGAMVRVAIAAAPLSWIQGKTLLTVYGRAFGTAPELGQLGQAHNFAELERQVRPQQEAAARWGGRPVQMAIHLIYALATPCAEQQGCLIYLDDTGVDIVRQYIKPAAERGWLVILDDQLGRSDPTAEMARMAARGYLAYDNVEVAFDPEFHTGPDQPTPGIPVGSVTAGELNAAERIMNRTAQAYSLPHRHLMLVHQWTPDMIRHRWKLNTSLPYVQPAVIMDAYGPPADKTQTYNSLLGRKPAQGALDGIKLFPPGWDGPPLTWQQLFGEAPVMADNGTAQYLAPAPRIIVLT